MGYLIHLIVYDWWSNDGQLPQYYTKWHELLVVFGMWTVVASIALVLWFVMEKPMTNMVTLFLKGLVRGNNDQGAKLRKVLIVEEAGCDDPTMATSINTSNSMKLSCGDIVEPSNVET